MAVRAEIFLTGDVMLTNGPKTFAATDARIFISLF